MFDPNSYTIFEAPNAEEIIDYVMSIDESLVDNSRFSWGNRCLVDKVPLVWDNIKELIKPSVNHLSSLNKKVISYEVECIWANLYNQGGYQEVHNHVENDFVCVFFANDGDKFSEFFFYDWESKSIAPISIEPGSIMFFSGQIDHGVSIHQSEVQRRTLSCNFNLVQ